MKGKCCVNLVCDRWRTRKSGWAGRMTGRTSRRRLEVSEEWLWVVGGGETEASSVILDASVPAVSFFIRIAPLRGNHSFDICFMKMRLREYVLPGIDMQGSAGGGNSVTEFMHEEDTPRCLTEEAEGNEHDARLTPQNE